jgi:outer membrane lipoprotein carrier protein
LHRRLPETTSRPLKQSLAARGGRPAGWSVGLAALLGLPVSSAVVHAQDDAAADPNALDAFIDSVQSFEAALHQEVWTADGELVETSDGRLFLERPDRFRLSYDTPYESLVVTDGKTLWMYDVDLEQVTRASLDEGLPATPAMLLSGDRGVADSFDVAETYSLDGRDWVKLIPKESGGDYTDVRIGFDAGLPRELEFVDGLNEVTRIQFSEIEVNPDLDAQLFEFTPPPGVDVLGGDEP